LFLRFILEMITLFMAGWWGWTMPQDFYRYILTIGMPVLLAIIWGVFAVKNDPSRSGKTVVNTPGWVRLIIEFLFFAFGTWIFYNTGKADIALLFAVIVLLHYVFSLDRIKWLLKQ